MGETETRIAILLGMIVIFLAMAFVDVGMDWLEKHDKEDPCKNAPFPSCNGAQGCDTCEHQKEE